MSEEIVKHEPISNSLQAVQALPLQGMQDIAALGEFIYASQMLGVSTPAAGVMVASTIHMLNITPLEFGMRWHVDNRGKVITKADRMLADFMAMGGKVQWLKFDAVEALAKWTYGDNKDLEIGFTFAEAKEAGYIKKGSNWEKDPGAQLRARCITRAIRMICPAAAAGLYSSEEMSDVYGHEAEQAAPVAIDQSDAAERLKAAAAAATTEPIPQQENQPIEIQVQAQPVETPFTEGPDVSLCPLPGNMCGIKWAEFADGDLAQVQKVSHQAMTQGHYDAIKQEINKRAAK
jgi:hypothetical protein